MVVLFVLLMIIDMYVIGDFFWRFSLLQKRNWVAYGPFWVVIWQKRVILNKFDATGQLLTFRTNFTPIKATNKPKKALKLSIDAQA